MSQFYRPTQYIYNSNNAQKNEEYNTVYRQKYLSRASNRVLEAIGENVVVNGVELISATAVGFDITLVFSSGIIITDSTLIELTDSTTITANVSAVRDTTDGCYLGVFTDFEYIETPDADSQTELALSLYHVDSGTPTAFSGSPAFDSDSNKLLLSKIEFVKSGAGVDSISEVSHVLTAGNSPSLLVSGTTFYMRGFADTSICMSNLEFFKKFYAISNLLQFIFHDMT